MKRDCENGTDETERACTKGDLRRTGMYNIHTNLLVVGKKDLPALLLLARKESENILLLTPI